MPDGSISPRAALIEALCTDTSASYPAPRPHDPIAGLTTSLLISAAMWTALLSLVTLYETL